MLPASYMLHRYAYVFVGNKRKHNSYQAPKFQKRMNFQKSGQKALTPFPTFGEQNEQIYGHILSFAFFALFHDQI